MSDQSDQQKTEEPTARRLREAREKGQIAYSADLASGAVFVVGILVLWFWGQHIAIGLKEMLRNDLSFLPGDKFGIAEAQIMAVRVLEQLAQISALLVGVVFLGGLAASMAQVGVSVTSHPLEPNWGKLSPFSGWTKLFSMKSAVKGLFAVLRLVVLCGLVAWILHGRFSLIQHAGRGSLSTTIANAWETGILLALCIGAAIVTVGLTDYVYQRWQHHQELLMTRQEVRDDNKQEEGDPQVRARIRKMQREASRNRMMRDVPEATVIVTNPTHIAVALKYERGGMTAPRVVAKGTGLVARRIRQIAEKSGIPVIERKPLARSLFAMVDVGGEIPLELYQAVAEILAYVFRLKRAG